MATATSGAMFQANTPVESQQSVDEAADKTTQALAGIFGLDLTTIGDAQEGTELVVNAVYRFIELYQECQEELMEANSQLSQLREDNGLDENGDPIQDDPNNPDPNAPVPDPDDPTQQLPGQPKPVPNQGLPAQQQKPVAQKPQPGQQPPQKGAPVVAKKPNPFAKKPPIAASFTPAVLKMAGGSRRNQIMMLAKDGCCTPEVANELIQDYCNESALSLSLSGDGSPGAFEREVSRLQRNGPVIHYGEQSGQQTQRVALEMSHGTSPETIATSPLVADAAARKDK